MSTNLEIIKNSDYTRTFTVYDNNGAVVPITGYTLSSQIRKNHTSTEYLSFVMTIIDGPLGKAQMFLPHSITNTLEGKYMYDIFITDSSSKRLRIADGLITLIPNITR